MSQQNQSGNTQNSQGNVIKLFCMERYCIQKCGGPDFSFSPLAPPQFMLEISFCLVMLEEKHHQLSLKVTFTF